MSRSPVRRAAGLAILAILAALAAPWAVSESVAAQQPSQPARSGFWIEGGTGAGTVRSACSACADVTVAYGTSTHLRAGGTLAPGVLLGLEIFALHSSDLRLSADVAPVDAENGAIAPVVLWYLGGGGFFLKGGVGLARGTFTVQSRPREPITTERGGLAISFGLGFDLGLARWLALTANLGTHVMAIGDVRVDGALADDVIATVYEAGLGLTLR